jgi:Organic Anion Transporter Polypeptide (OATP) family
MPSSTTSCGLSWCGYPQFLQKYATTRSFILVYGLLGTFQAMGYIYFVITLQTLEKRFKIPSQTTGELSAGDSSIDRESIGSSGFDFDLLSPIGFNQSPFVGIILSGNEISQILLSVVLSYFGGQRNR